MEWLPIAVFILLGLILIVAEIIFIPGTTVVGIVGLLCMGYGIFQSYAAFGNTIGTITLISSLVASILLFYLSFRNRSWEKFSLKETMDGKVNDHNKFVPKVADRGLSISALKPVGKAIFNDHEIEVRSNGGFIDENVEIEVLRIEDSKIFVKTV
jgi:membrane-bound ClpP family serine protease